MKQIILLIVVFSMLPVAYAQTGTIEQILRNIEENNKELKANGQLTQSKKLEAKTDNNLSDPTVNYSYQFGSPQELGKSGELTVAQGFDFPTLYGSRNKLNKLKAVSFDKQNEAFRRDILLKAKELCLDYILLNQEKKLLDDRLKNAEQLAQIYEKRLQTGDANILETNKIKMELQGVQAEAATNSAARQTILQELIAMNGNQPVELSATEYSPVEEILDLAGLKEEVLASDLDLQALESESEAAKKQITVNKSGWLPKLEVGYRRNTGTGEQFNGFIVGGSIPLFENKNKVKIAKAQSLYADLQKENAELQVENAFLSLYNEMEQLKRSMKAYDIPLMDSSLNLLKQALNARQISIIEYFTEVSGIYQNYQNYMQLQNRYQKVMSQIYKNKL